MAMQKDRIAAAAREATHAVAAGAADLVDATARRFAAIAAPDIPQSGRQRRTLTPLTRGLVTIAAVLAISAVANWVVGRIRSKDVRRTSAPPGDGRTEESHLERRVAS